MRAEHLGASVPLGITGLGLLFGIVVCVEAGYVYIVGNPLGTAWWAGLLTSLPFVVGIAYLGTELSDELVSPGRYERVAWWCVGGAGVFLSINLVLMLALPPTSGLQVASWVRRAATLGAGSGLLIGVFEGRAIEAEREHLRAEQAEADRELLEYLNATLRHEVLNASNVVRGHADLVATACDCGEVTDHTTTISSRAQEMEAVIDDVRSLLRASREPDGPGTVDVVAILTAELTALQQAHAGTTVDTAWPERAPVRADRPIRRAFGNLLWNAVEHNECETPRIELTVSRHPDTVEIEIADNGPGVPAAERETLFELELRHDASHGLGLILAHRLVEKYDGTLELTDTGADGSVFTVTLPRAEPIDED